MFDGEFNASFETKTGFLLIKTFKMTKPHFIHEVGLVSASF